MSATAGVAPTLDERAPVARLAALAGLVVLTRLPLLGTGYGTDTDAWSVAQVARRLAGTGVYRPSRLPGFPLQEITCAAVSGWGSWGINGLAMLWSAAAAVLFALILHRLRARVNVAAGAALVFVPAVYVASASGMDYVWGLALLLAAVLAVMARRHVVAGLLLGLAIGTRVTDAVFLLPLAIMAAEPGRFSAGRWLRRTGTMGAVAALVALACYLPVWFSSGPDFLMYSGHAGGHSQGLGNFLTGLFRLFPLPIQPLLVAGQATVWLWGLVGCAALGLALVFGWRPVTRSRSAALPGPPVRHVVAWIVAILLVAWLYLRLPDDEGYLIPAVPFVLLLLATGLTPRAMRWVCAALVLSPFVFGLDAALPKKGVRPATRSIWAMPIAPGGGEPLVLDPLRGPVRMDLDKRRTAARYVEAARERWSTLPDGSVIVAGLLVYPLLDRLPPHPPRMEDILAEPDVRALVTGGRAVYYLPDAPERTRRFFGYDLAATGARPLLPLSTEGK